MTQFTRPVIIDHLLLSSIIDDRARGSLGAHMKYVSYTTADTLGGPRVGQLRDGIVVDVGFDGDMVAFIEHGAPVGRTSEVTGARLTAPLRPVVLRDFLTFEGHLRNAFAGLGKEIPDEWFSVPAYYKGIPSTVIGPDAVVPWPSYTDRLDHELEVAAVIGRAGRDMNTDAAWEHIFGFTLWNDLSARDVQTRELPVGMGPSKAKDWDGSNVLGPCIVTIDELDPTAIEAEVRVNDEVWGRDNTANMRFTFADLIEYAAHDQTVHVGEVIGSGTLAGGSGVEFDRWLQPGDVVELRSPQLGALRNTIGPKPPAAPKSIEVTGNGSVENAR